MTDQEATDVEIEDAVTDALDDSNDVDDSVDDTDDADEGSEEGGKGEQSDTTVDREPTRGEKRHQVLANSLKEERERRETLEREVAEIKAASQARSSVSNAEAVRIREEKLSLMEPHEKQLFVQNEEIQRLKEAQFATQMHVMDATDKAAYDAKATFNPIYEKHRDAVEKALSTLRANGNTTNREELLKWVIGHEALKAKPAKADAAKKQAAAVRVSAAKGKPTSARSDAGSYTGKGGSVEDRLRGVLI